MSEEYVFISYKSEEADKASQTKQIIEANGIKCWMAPKSIPFGSDYASEIDDAIRGCKAVVLILSEASQKSDWIPKEIDLALNQRKPVIPFHIDCSQLVKPFSFYLTNVQRIEAYTRLTEAYAELLAQLKAILGLASSEGQAGRENVLVHALKPGKEALPVLRQTLNPSRFAPVGLAPYSARPWIDHRVAEWKESGGQFLLIRSSAGTGKSSVMCHLVKEGLLPGVYFNSYLSNDNQNRFLSSLAYHLAETSEAYCEGLISILEEMGRFHPGNKEETEKDARALAELPLLDVIANILIAPFEYVKCGQIVIGVDAVDENPDLVMSCLEQLRGTPIRFVLTSRPDVRFARLSPQVIDLDHNSEETTGDIRAYLAEQLNEFPEDQIAQVAQAAGSSFTYAEKYAAYLADGGDLSEIPEELGGVYTLWMRRLFPEHGQFAAVEPALSLLAVNNWSVRKAEFKTILNMTERQYQDFMKKMHGFVVRADDDTIMLYHYSLVEWFHSSDLAEEYYIPEEDGCRRILDFCFAAKDDPDHLTFEMERLIYNSVMQLGKGPEKLKFKKDLYYSQILLDEAHTHSDFYLVNRVYKDVEDVYEYRLSGSEKVSQTESYLFCIVTYTEFLFTKGTDSDLDVAFDLLTRIQRDAQFEPHFLSNLRLYSFFNDNLAWVYRLQKKYELALKQITDTIDYLSDKEFAEKARCLANDYYSKAYVLYDMKKDDEAITNLKTAIRLAEGQELEVECHGLFYGLLAWPYSRKHCYAEALECCTKAINNKRLSYGQMNHSLALSMIAYARISLYRYRDDEVMPESVALEYAREAVRITVTLFGEAAPRTIVAYRTLIAAEYFIARNLEAVEKLLNRLSGISSLPEKDRQAFHNIRMRIADGTLGVDDII